MAGNGPQLLAQRDFSGGLELRFDSHTLPDNAVMSAQNVIFRPGAVRKRKGTRKFNATSLGTGRVRGLFRLYRSNGMRAFVAAHGTKLYGTTSTSGSFDTIASSLTEEWWDFDAWKDLAFGTSATNGLYEWSGAGVAAAVSGTPPKAAFVRQHQNYLFLAGDPSAKSTLYWSDLDDHTSWPADNFSKIADENGRGDWITGLSSVHGDLIIFMRRSTYLWVGDSPTNAILGEVFSGIGCVSHRTIDSDGGWTYFLGHDGLYRMQGTLNGMNLDRLSDPVQPLIDACPDLSNACGALHDHFYWLALPSSAGTTNDLILVYDLQTKAWTTFTGLSPSYFSVWDGPGDKGEIYFGSDTAGAIYQGDFGHKDDATDITAKFQTKFYDAKQPFVVKQFRRASVDCKSSGAEWTLDWSTDQDAATGSLSVGGADSKDLLGTGVTGTMKTRDNIHTVTGDSLSRAATGRSLSLTFTHSSDAAAGDLLGFEAMWLPRRLRI